ncbi:MAG: flavodoxin [Helicobacteraceae bacterium]|jgi:flavodoxin I|nr:flavodoxin [Helicobacteraceae bacterium]
MAKIGLFYGSTSGHTAKVAEAISAALGEKHEVTIINMEDISSLDDLLEYDNLILGSSTWGQGDLQNDWRDPFSEMDEADFSGKTVALFGAGDSEKHGEHFASAIGVLYNKLVERGAKVVGEVSADDYRFKSSLALKNGKFVGLAIDEINEPSKTKARIEAWARAIDDSFS